MSDLEFGVLLLNHKIRLSFIQIKKSVVNQLDNFIAIHFACLFFSNIVNWLFNGVIHKSHILRLLLLYQKESNEFFFNSNTLRDSLLNFPFDSKYHFAHNDFIIATFKKKQTYCQLANRALCDPSLNRFWHLGNQVIFLNKRETQIDVGGCIKMFDQRR